MSKNKKKIWSIGSIVVFGALLNAFIIASAYFYSTSLLWILLITIPLLIFGVYNARQTSQILTKYRVMSQQESEKQNNYKWLSHSIYPNKIDETDLRVLIGNDQCSQPYNTCIFNIRSINNIHPRKSIVQETSNKNLDYSKNSCEEMLRTYCLTGKDLVWQIEPDFIGCRVENGNFSGKIFKQMSRRPEIKMIELMLSSATKPIRPIDPFLDIGNTAKNKINENTFPELTYTTFREAEGMIHFLDGLRELSGGKPIGIRLSVSSKKEFNKICYAIRKTHLVPDFITIEGSLETATGDHSGERMHTEMPLYEAILFVTQTLQFYGLEKEIKVIVSGRIISSLDTLKALAVGANAICTDIHEYRTIKYPDPDRKISSLYEAADIDILHRKHLKETLQAMRVCGFANVSDITLSKLLVRLDSLHLKRFGQLKDITLYPGIVKKMYHSEIESYHLQEKRRKEYMKG